MIRNGKKRKNNTLHEARTKKKLQKHFVNLLFVCFVPISLLLPENCDFYGVLYATSYFTIYICKNGPCFYFITRFPMDRKRS